MDRKILFVSLGLIIFLGVAVYYNSLDGEFLWDDEYLVENNAYIKSGAEIRNIFTRDIAAGSGREFTSYRPLQTLSYMADYRVWGLNARGYHFTNIFLHILAALCVYWLTAVLFRDKSVSLLAGLLFVIHPVHTNAVAYISGRADSLAMIFILLCVIFYVKDSVFPSALACALALLSRENALIIPALLVLYHYAFRKRPELKKITPVLGIVLIYVLLRFTLLKIPLPHLSRATTLLERLPGFFVAVTNYLKILFFPVGLHMEYGNRLFSITDPRAIAGIAIMAALLIAAFKSRKKGTGYFFENDKAGKSSLSPFFALMWFILTLLPHSNLYPIDAYMAEHWLYVPSVGFFIILSAGLIRLYKKFKIPAAVLILSILLFYSSVTVAQNTYWNDPEALYGRILRYNPESWRAHNNLANIYVGRGEAERAIASYKKVLEINPDYAEGYYNLGNVYKDIKRYKEAADSYRRAIELNPSFSRAYNNLGAVYNMSGRHREASEACGRALEIDPNDMFAYNNMAIACFNMGEYDRARMYLDRAVELGFEADPKFLDALHPYKK